MKLGEFKEEDVLKLARHVYESGTASFEIVTQKCALLVIDLQEEFVRPNWAPSWVPGATRIIPKVKN